MFPPLSYTDASTAPNSALNPRRVVVFDRVCANAEFALKTTYAIPKDSCKIVNTLPSDIFEVSAISRKFNLRSPKTNL